ncbi:MAG: hypothetical protein AAGD14_11935 [Planctomycetota bacterium]
MRTASAAVSGSLELVSRRDLWFWRAGCLVGLAILFASLIAGPPIGKLGGSALDFLRLDFLRLDFLQLGLAPLAGALVWVLGRGGTRRLGQGIVSGAGVTLALMLASAPYLGTSMLRLFEEWFIVMLVVPFGREARDDRATDRATDRTMDRTGATPSSRA